MSARSRRTPTQARHTRGFTLVEVLVVIAIITVLMAVLLPVLTRARRSGKRLVCQSNLKQIAQAWHFYLDDHNGRFYKGLNADVDFVGWQGLYIPDAKRPLNDYLSLSPTPESEQQAQVARCPADRGNSSSRGLPVYTTHGTSYRTNHLLIGPDKMPPLPDATLTEAINVLIATLNGAKTDNHARLLLVGDNGWIKQWWPNVPGEEGWHGRPHHFNLAFMDGHVEFLEIQKGRYITDHYTVLPSQKLYGLGHVAQAPAAADGG